MAGTSAFTPTPARISNRGLIRQMELHGWRVKKVNGEDTLMKSPAGDLMTVRSAHCHSGNAPKALQEVLRIMQMTWDEFMFVPDALDETVGSVMRSIDLEIAPEEGAKLLDAISSLPEHTEKYREHKRQERAEAQRQAQREAKEARKAARAAERQREDTTVNAMAEHSTEPRQRGNADRVFEAILGHSGPITNQQLADLTGIDKIKVGSAALYLFNDLGVIDRVKRGVWQRRHEYSAHDMTFDVVSRNLDLIRSQGLTTAAQATVTPLRPEPAPVVTPVAATIAASTPATRDGDLNDMLDLLFPGGFRASHLPAIDAWKQATARLMDIVEGQR